MHIESCVNWLKLIFLALTLGNVGAKMTAFLTSIECRNYTPEIWKNVSCYTNRTLRNTSILSVELASTEDVNDLKGHFLLTIERGSHVADYLSLDMDYCQLFASQHKNLLIRTLTYDVRKSSNFPMECPFEKNKRYFVKDYSLDLKMLPSYVPEFNFTTDMKFNFKRKLTFQVILRGKVIRN